ncbi:hypothetical protein P9112_011534 [Eukaryota sp. TZLM1-RC]
MVVSSKWPLASPNRNILNVNDSCPIDNAVVIDFVQQAVDLCKPKSLVWIDGSESQLLELKTLLCERGSCQAIPARPNSYLARSDPRDVARNPKCTFICSETKDEAGPLNNWADPEAMRDTLSGLFDGCMVGREMYVIPFSMGPLGSDLSQYGIQITDSAYVVVNMAIMARVSSSVYNYIGEADFVPCVHSVGSPLPDGQEDVTWPCNPDKRHIVHFTKPGNESIVSFGSGYGGNSLLGKKCFALRIASIKAKNDDSAGRLAEHCFILGVKGPNDAEKRYVLGAFPSACGKTNAAMLLPTIPGYETSCVGDDIVWLKVDDEGVLRGVNPENGFFGVAPGTSYKTNPHVMTGLEKNCMFVNCAFDEEKGDVWWEGMTEEVPSKLIDWKGNEWTPESTTTAAHPNARYTCPAIQCPIIDPEFENPKGVKVDAFLFGGRRNDTVPICLQSQNWEHGVLLASTIASESTAAQDQKRGVVGVDPFAMKPFIGYHAGDYFAHWLKIGKMLGDKAPKIFLVNWFQRNDDNKFIWPGFGDNVRVIDWILKQCDSNEEISTLGKVPSPKELNLEGLSIPEDELKQILSLDTEQWRAEIERMKQFIQGLGRYPDAFDSMLADMAAAL